MEGNYRRYSIWKGTMVGKERLGTICTEDGEGRRKGRTVRDLQRFQSSEW